MTDDVSNDERESLLRESEARFRGLVDNMPQLAWMGDASGSLFWYNQRWFEYTGTCLEEMKGWGWRSVHHPDHVERVIAKFASHVEAGEAWEDTFPLRRADGVYRWFLSRATPFRDTDGKLTHWFGTNTDVTEQRDTLIALEASERQLNLLDRIGQATRNSTDPVEIMQVTARQLGEHLGVTRCAYADVALDNDRFTIRHDWTAPGFAPSVGSYSLALFGSRSVDGFRRGQTVAIDEVERELAPDDGVAMFAAMGIKAVIGCPLVTDEGLRGILAMHSSVPRHWSPLEISLVERVAERSWAHIERIGAQAELRQSEARMTGLVATVPSMVWAADAQGETLYMSRWFQRYAGRDADQFETWHWPGIVHPDDLEATYRAWQTAVSTGTTYEHTLRARRADGVYRWHRVRSEPVLDDAGNIASWCGAGADIHQQVETAEALAESEARFRGLAENMKPLAWIADGDGRMIWFSQRLLDYVGAMPEQLADWRWIMHPDHVERLVEQFNRCLVDGTPYEDTFPMRAANGDFRWFLTCMRPLHDADGSVARWFGTNSDVTEQRESALALQASEARLAGATALAKMATYVLDVASGTLHADERMSQLWGLTTPRPLIFSEVLEAVHPDERDRIKLQLTRALDPNGTGIYDEEARVIGIDDGITRWIHSHARTEFSKSTRTQMVGFSIDIGDRKASEAAQAAILNREREHSERLQILAQASLAINAASRLEDVIASVTEQSRLLIPSHVAIGGVLTGADWSTGLHHQSLSEKYARYRNGTALSMGNAMQRLVCESNQPMRLTQDELAAHPASQNFGNVDETLLPWRGWLAAPLIGRDGTNLGLLQLSDRAEGEFTADDEAILVQLASIAAVAIENSRLYAAFRDSDRRKDEFLATLAHELRNPLAPIRNTLEILDRKRDSVIVDLSLPLLKRQVTHMTRLVDDLFEVARISRGELQIKREPVALAAVLKSAIESARPKLDARGHRFVAELPDDEVMVDADAVRLSQVFINLLNNAVKYTPEGGNVWMSAQVEQSLARVSVRDSGIGIPAAMLPHVFEMFAQVDRSLHGAQDGLGIGLAIVDQVLKMHGGSVAASSAGAGLGSEFVVTLPLIELPSSPASPSLQIEPKERARRILIVDDNRDAADSLGALLDLLGHRSQVVYDGESALVAMQQFQPAMALLDLGMPNMDGLELARRIRELPSGQSIRLIALTGWGQPEDQRRVVAAGFDAHVVKPVDIKVLQALLHTNPSLTPLNPWT